MKTYSADNELADILLKKGYNDFTSERDIIKGKRCFKITRNSQKEFYFNYDNIIL